jgi:hypothetical protein
MVKMGDRLLRRPSLIMVELPKKADIGETIVRKRKLHRAKMGAALLHTPTDFQNQNVAFLHV